MGSRAYYDSPFAAVLNGGFMGVTGGDYGQNVLYKGRFYFAPGDTILNYPIGSTDNFTQHVRGSFFVAYSKPVDELNLDYGIELAGYAGGVPSKAIRADGYIMPASLFTIKQNNQEYMFCHYMNGIEFVGNDHHINFAGIAKFDDNEQIFNPYKSNVNQWQGTWRHFGMASFYPDYSTNYLYGIGSASGRFCGTKLIRMPIPSFLDSLGEYVFGRAIQLYDCFGIFSSL